MDIDPEIAFIILLGVYVLFFAVFCAGRCLDAILLNRHLKRHQYILRTKYSYDQIMNRKRKKVIRSSPLQ